MVKQRPHNLSDIRRNWPVLSVYERFESFVALLLTFVIAAVIVVALWRLTVSTTETLVLRSLNPLDHAVFQRVFGDILTLLIALEFNHTLRYVITRDRGIIQVRAVILIAVLALVRRILVTDLATISAAVLVGEGALVLSFGITYWLMRDRAERRRSS